MSRTSLGFLAGFILFAACDVQSPLAPGRGGPSAAARVVTDPSTSLFASASNDKLMSLSWMDGSRSETGWEVHRSTTGPSGAFALLATLAKDATGYADAGLTPLKEYCYKVRSFKKAGPKTTFDAFYNTSCATMYGPPPAPSSLDAIPAPEGIRLGWTDNSTTEGGFRLERASDPAGPWSAIASLPANPSSQGAYTDGSRPAEQRACYRLIAFNTWGQAVSNADCTVPPAYPADVIATVAGAALDLAWTDNSAFEDGYEVQRRTDFSEFAPITTLHANATSYHDADVVGDTRYWYQVRAIKDGGFSYWIQSNGVVLVTAPPPPVEIGAYPYSSSGVVVYWNSSSLSATGARIERSADGQSGWVTVGNVGTNEWGGAFGEEGLATEQRVCYRAFAFNSLGESPPSNVACTVPPAAPTNLTERVLDDGTIEERWQDNSQVEDGYVIWLRAACDYYCYDDFYDYVGPDITTYINAYTGYGYAIVGVAALKDGGSSDWLFSAAYGASPASAGARSTVRSGAQPNLIERKPLMRAPPFSARPRRRAQ